jgi:hypothetical protein
LTDPYSFLLALAVSALALAWVLLIASRWWPATRRGSTAAALLAAALDLASLVIHVGAGHRPGSPDGMTVGGFVSQHPAFVVVLAASAAALALATTTARQAGTG